MSNVNAMSREKAMKAANLIADEIPLGEYFAGLGEIK